jgi:hypothetical protein
MNQQKEIELYRKKIKKVLNIEFYLEIEDLEHNKILIINPRKYDLEKEEECTLVLNIDRKTGKAKGYTRNNEFIQKGPELKKTIEDGYRIEKLEKLFKKENYELKKSN